MPGSEKPQAFFMKILEKEFEPYLDETLIQQRIKQMASDIDKDYQGRNPLFISVLKGAYIFTSDLLRALTIPHEVTFIQLSSYQGTASTGSVRQKIGLDQDLRGRNVIILDDIVDTGLTSEHLINQLNDLSPSSVEFGALLLKEEIFKERFPIRYVGFRVENKFLVGYGMDYNEFGRNLPSIYKIVD